MDPEKKDKSTSVAIKTIDAVEVSKMLGISRSTVSRRNRFDKTFPKAKFASGPGGKYQWSLKEVEEYKAKSNNRFLRKKHNRPRTIERVPAPGPIQSVLNGGIQDFSPPKKPSERTFSPAVRGEILVRRKIAKSVVLEIPGYAAYIVEDALIYAANYQEMEDPSAEMLLDLATMIDDAMRDDDDVRA